MVLAGTVARGNGPASRGQDDLPAKSRETGFDYRLIKLLDLDTLLCLLLRSAPPSIDSRAPYATRHDTVILVGHGNLDRRVVTPWSEIGMRVAGKKRRELIALV
jgi:hypothetical protein